MVRADQIEDNVRHADKNPAFFQVQIDVDFRYTSNQSPFDIGIETPVAWFYLFQGTRACTDILLTAYKAPLIKLLKT